MLRTLLCIVIALAALRLGAAETVSAAPAKAAMAASAVAAEPPAPVTLAELEAEVPPAQPSPEYWAWAAKTMARAMELIESGTLRTGEEFFRVSKFIFQVGNRYRAERVRYELRLAAAALGHTDAQKQVAGGWDMLLATLGRPLRTDFTGLVARYPKQYQADPAPASIQAVLRDPAAARELAKAATDNPEVEIIRDADQADRRIDWSKITPEEREAIWQRDHARNARTLEIIAAGELRTAQDFSRAALVMQHSTGFAGYQLAHELAVCSMLLGDRSTGRWLVTAAYDRLLGSVGHDQRFGTQYSGMGGVSTLMTVDTAGICDAQREALGCPTLEQARNRDLRRPAMAAATVTGGMTTSVASFIGPNRALRDPQYGLAATYPESWTLARVLRWGDQQTTLSFATGPEFPGGNLYYRVYRMPIPRTAEEMAAHIRTEAQKKEEARRGSWPDYTNRPEGVRAYQVGNYTAYSWLADFTQDGKKYVEYFLRFQTAEADASFFLQAPVEQIEAARPQVEAFMASLKMPTMPGAK